VFKCFPTSTIYRGAQDLFFAYEHNLLAYVAGKTDQELAAPVIGSWNFSRKDGGAKNAGRGILVGHDLAIQDRSRGFFATSYASWGGGGGGEGGNL
jgi:hypothetical protein